MNIIKLQDDFLSGKLRVYDYIQDIFNIIEKNDFNSYLALNKKEALNQAKKLDEKISQGEKLGKLFGVPVSVKDNILTKGLTTTASSQALENFNPIYSASLVDKLLKEDAIIIGKTNMDEFAMGGSSETSYFGKTINPYAPGKIPGGSSSGAAASIAGNEALLAIGTDTGGSVRNPAHYTNTVGYAPSYGVISRYGVVSMANSIDRVGLLASNVGDIKLGLDVVKGRDPQDLTSIDIEEYKETIRFEDLNIAFIDLDDSYSAEAQVIENYKKALETISSKGSKVTGVRVENLKYANALYTILMAVEVASNMSRIDGVRLGESIDDYSSLDDFYIKNRSKYLGEEVKRRIALGSYFSSRENKDKYYIPAMKLRNELKKELDYMLDEYDFIISPTTTDLPYSFGTKKDDANSSFDSGSFNVITNLSNLPSISLPVDKNKLGSIQIIGKRNEDYKLLEFAELLERSF